VPIVVKVGYLCKAFRVDAFSIATRKGREEEWNAYLYYDASRSSLNNLSSLSLITS
jgi:hypothetical protein